MWYARRAAGAAGTGPAPASAWRRTYLQHLGLRRRHARPASRRLRRTPKNSAPAAPPGGPARRCPRRSSDSTPVARRPCTPRHWRRQQYADAQHKEAPPNAHPCGARPRGARVAHNRAPRRRGRCRACSRRCGRDRARRRASAIDLPGRRGGRSRAGRDDASQRRRLLRLPGACRVLQRLRVRCVAKQHGNHFDLARGRGVESCWTGGRKGPC
jgi:hypothetical protein